MKEAISYSIMVLGLVLLIMFGVRMMSSHKLASDAYVRQRVLKLYSEKGSCTGVEIVSRGGNEYVLTAGHCKPLLNNNQILAEDEQGRHMILDFVAESADADLMLLQGGFPALPGIKIADDLRRNEHIHTMTHGGGKLSYRTDGDVVQDEDIAFVESQIKSDQEALDCHKPKNAIVADWFGQQFCAVKEIAMVATATIVPGSSGGPVLNERGELVGIASATGEHPLFGYFVRLVDIQAFMRGR